MVDRASTPPGADGDGEGEGDGDGEGDGEGEGEGEGVTPPALVAVERAGTVSVAPSENLTVRPAVPKLCATYVRVVPFRNTAAVGMSAVTPGSTVPRRAKL